MPDVWFATCAAHPRLPPDEAHLVRALAARGVVAAPALWTDPALDWGAARLCLPRATWDYSWHIEAFLAWIDAVAARTTLLNPPALLRWNAHKGYLVELAARGVPTLPTIRLARGSDVDLAALVAHAGWREFVLKPAVAQTARETLRLGRGEVRRGQAHLARLLPAEDFLLQRFEPGVLAEGERSLFFADGAFTHAVEKRAAPGDWRVQDDFGGVARRVRPAVDEHDVALGALAALPAPAFYARVDLLRDGTGGPRVIEVELIEPAHFFEECPGAAEPYADAIARRLA